MPFAAAVAGAAISAGAGIYAANKQSDTAERGQDIAQQQFQQQRTDTSPWRTTGAQALPATADLLGLNGPDAAAKAMGNFQTSPGYQWQLEQGLRAVDAGAAGQGMLRSGATLKAEQEYGQGLANQDFTNYYNRLFGLSQLGGNVAVGGATNASGAAQAALGGANAQNSITGNLAQGLSSSANTLLNNPNFQDWTKGLWGGGATQYDPSPVVKNEQNQWTDVST
jgi:hypothetical protein